MRPIHLEQLLPLADYLRLYGNKQISEKGDTIEAHYCEFILQSRKYRIALTEADGNISMFWEIGSVCLWSQEIGTKIFLEPETDPHILLIHLFVYSENDMKRTEVVRTRKRCSYVPLHEYIQQHPKTKKVTDPDGASIEYQLSIEHQSTKYHLSVTAPSPTPAVSVVTQIGNAYSNANVITLPLAVNTEEGLVPLIEAWFWSESADGCGFSAQ